MPKKAKTEAAPDVPSMGSLQPLFEIMTSLLGRLVFPEEKLRDIVMWKKRNPEDYVKAYNLCDGNHTLSQIAEAIHVNVSTLSRIFPDWEDMGIIYEVNKSGGRFYKKLYKLGMPKETEEAEEPEVEKAEPKAEASAQPVGSNSPSQDAAQSPSV